MNVIAHWPNSASPLRIDYSPAAMDQIRHRVQVALEPRSGSVFCVGGILLGEHRDDSLTLVDSIEIPCSHASGPAFILTKEEKRRSWELLARAGKLSVIGWYCSKPAGSLTLSDSDRNLYSELFPQPWQISLLVGFNAGGPARAAIFARHPSGEIVKTGETSASEWQPQTEQTDTSAPADSSGPRALPVSVLFSALESSNAKNRLPWAIGAAALLIAATAGFMTRDLWMPVPALQLTSRDINGKLEIRWNPGAVRHADHASVFINDGDNSQTVEIDLDSSQLSSGVLLYYRKSGHVKATLAVAGQRAATEYNAK